MVDAALVGLSFWLLGGFFSALAWAVVLTIATWPLYDRFLLMFPLKLQRGLAPLLFTLLIALVFIVPVGVAVVETWREANQVMHWVTSAERTGTPVPPWLSHVPTIGPRVAAWWQHNLSEPGGITDVIGHTDTGHFARVTQEVGLLIARRLSFLALTVLTLVLPVSRRAVARPPVPDIVQTACWGSPANISRRLPYRRSGARRMGWCSSASAKAPS